MTTKEKEIAFEKSHQGFTIRATYKDGPDARIEITREGAVYRAFDYPSYRIWNLAAHFEDMVAEFVRSESEPAGVDEGDMIP